MQSDQPSATSNTGRGSLATLLALLATLVAAAPSQAAITFGTATNLPVGTRPQGIAIADFNGDTKNDVAITDYGSMTTTSTVYIFLGDGTGTGYTAASGSPITLTGQLGAYSLIADDFDGDGKKDLAVTNLGSDTVSILRGNGDGTFAAPVTLTMTGGNTTTPVKEPISAAAGLFNNDAKRDLVVADFGSGTGTQDVQVFLNTSTGTGNIAFAAGTSIATGNEAAYVVTANFDSANRDDFAVTNLSDNTITVYLNNGSASFSGTAYPTSDGTTSAQNPAGMAVADLNEDTHPDLVVGCFGTSDQDLTARVAVFLGNSSGTFGTPTFFDRGDTGPQTAAIADFDADGHQDVVVANNQSNTVSVYAGNGTGSLAAAVNYSINGGSAGTAPFLVAAGTLNSDTKPDIITTNFDGNVAVLLNTSTTTSNADLQVVSVTDSKTTAVPGTTDSYVITIRNNGPITVTSATMTLTPPAAMPPTTYTPSAGAFDSGTGAWTGLSLASTQTATLTVSGTINGAATGTMTFTAAIAPPVGITDPNTANNSAADNDTVLTVQADLSVTKTDGQTRVIPGQALTYSIVVSNAGPNPATNATVTDTFPASLTSVTWTCAGGSGGSCTTASASGNINNTVTLPVGGTATFTASATVAGGASGSIANTATIAAPGGVSDPTPGNNSATDTDSVDQAPTADAQSVDVNVNAATGITLTGSDPESDAITFSIVTPPTHGNLTGLNANTGAVTYTPTTAYTGPDSFTFKTTDAAPFNRDSAAATVSITVVPVADLSVTKTDGVTRVVPGQAVTYTIVVSNAGPATATLATVTDTPPAGLTTVTWTCTGASGGSCTTASGSNTINNTVTLPVGGKATFSVSATVSGSASGSISNTAAVAPPSGTGDPVSGNNSATDVDAVDAAPAADAQSLTVNSGSSNNAIVLTGSDPESDAITFAIVGSPSHGALSGFNAANGHVNYTPTAGYGGADSFTFKTTDSLGRDSATATVSITVTPISDLSITKTDGVARVAPNRSLTYTLVVSNAGPATATNATVTDTFPASLTGITWTCAGASGGSCTTGAGAGNINNTVTLPTGGKATFTASATVGGGASGSIANTATVAAPGGTTDPTPGNNSATDTDSVDQAPTANAQSVTATQNAATDITLTASDPESDALTFAVGTPPVHGSLSAISGANVTYTPDTDYVGPDSFTFTATDTFGRASGAATVTINVVPGVSPVHFSADVYSVTEGGTSTITVRRDDFASALDVDYTIADGTAHGGTDYDNSTPCTASSPCILSFKAKGKSASFKIRTFANTLADGERTVLITLRHAGAGSYVGSLSTAILAIHDNDTGGTVQFSGASYTVNESETTALIKLTRTKGTASDVTVDFTAAGGTATAVSDYDEILAQPVTFGAKQSSVTVPVTIHDNGTTTGGGTVELLLDNPTGGVSLGTQTAATLTIVAGNPVLQFATEDFTAKESSSKGIVTVKRFGPNTDVVSVHYETTHGSAVPGVDYTDVSGDLTFKKGQTSLSFQVPIVNDQAHEANRTVLLDLSSVANLTNAGQVALGVPDTAVLTINDPDKVPTVQFSAKGYKVTEAGKGADKIVVKRSGATATTITVDYAATDETAVSPTNYEVGGSGTLTFGPGVVSQPIPVTIHNVADASNNAFKITLSNPQTSNAVAELGTQSEVEVTIQSDDPLVQFSTAAYKVNETGPKATITVKRSGAKTGQAIVHYATSDGSATAPEDYTATSGDLTFDPKVTSLTFDVPVADSALVEPDQTVNLTLSNATGAGLGPISTAVLTLLTDDPSVVFSRDGFKVAETGKKATITVKRLGNKSVAFTVPFTTTDGTALDGINYTDASAVLDFPKGAATRSVSVPILHDTADNPPPVTVSLALGAPTGATLGTPSTAALVIDDKDVAGTVQFSASDYSVSETGFSAVITVTRSGGKASDVTVDWAASDGTATSANYVAASGTVLFAADQTSASFTVDVKDDGAAAGSKTVNLTLSNPQGGATIGARDTATLWIADTQ